MQRDFYANKAGAENAAKQRHKPEIIGKAQYGLKMPSAARQAARRRALYIETAHKASFWAR